MHTKIAVRAGALALGAALALTSVQVGSAAASPRVTVRVEGRLKTLLPARSVQTQAGSITRGGAPAGVCPASSVQGALATATHGNWRGSWYASYSEYYLTGILGDSESGKHYYWAFYVNGRYATKGACGVALRPGDSVVFAAVPSKGATPKLLGVVDEDAVVGRPFTAKVVYYDARGHTHPLAGAIVRVDGRTVRTGPAGNTTPISFSTAGKQMLEVSKPHYVRTEASVLVTA